jgi:nitrite reductase/ring-hydroxylating ferredoxin subunit
METETQPKMSREYSRLGAVAELDPNGQFSRWLEGHDILVYRMDGQIKALSNICPHFGGPVGFHKMRNGIFTCLWHNYQFDAKSGKCLTNKALCLREYTLKVEAGEIWVCLVESPGAE